MSETIASLSDKIGSAGELQSVVRTMKAIAAASIGQYENAVCSLDAYYRTVQLGLAVCLRENKLSGFKKRTQDKNTVSTAAIVFGSDQGLVGQFNDTMVEFVATALKKIPEKKKIWALGERIQPRLMDAGLSAAANFVLPNSISGITPLVRQILVEAETLSERNEIGKVYLFHHRPGPDGTYAPIVQCLLPLDEAWLQEVATIQWPTSNLPQIIGVGGKEYSESARGHGEACLLAFLREYLFILLFKACAESLASENASRLAAMQRAEKNIDELLEDLNKTYHRLRQSGIDEELFDVISGFEALANSPE